MLLERLAGRLGRAAVYEPRPVADAQPEHAWMALPPGQGPRSAGGAMAPADARGRAARGKDRHGNSHVGPSPAPERRPLWMFPRPVRLDPVRLDPVQSVPREPSGGRASSGVPASGVPARFRYEARIHRVLCAQGPERIETAWWRGPTVRRDYYVVETSSGARYWIFRRLRSGPVDRPGGEWFLHGTFS